MLSVSQLRAFVIAVFINFLVGFENVNADDIFEPSSDNVLASCKDARVVDNTQQYCSFAAWNAAHIYARVNYTDYSPGNPLSDATQNHYAVNIYEKLLRTPHDKSINSECSSALQRLACVTAFPSCQVSGSSISAVSYNLPCRLQCEQANARCPFVLSCDDLPETNCLLTLPPGYFVIEPKSGPFEPLPIIYGISLAIWIIFAITWNYLTFVRYKNACVIFCRVVSGIPIIKVVVLAFGMVFWSTGVSWRMYSFWMSIAVTNTQLVYETGQMLVFLLIAKGWTITRDNFGANEWRGVIIALSAFYMSNSIIIVLQTSVLTVPEFWLANTLLYGSMFAYIYTCVSYQLSKLKKQVSLLNSEMPADIVNPLRMKYAMYLAFLVLVLISAGMEVCSHAVMFADGKVWHVLLGYEISNVVILGTMGIVFRPQEYSPFFFMVPARLNDTRTRPIPILEAADDGAEDPEVELGPLLMQPDLILVAPAKMIVLRNPDKAVSVGVSATAASMVGRSDPHHRTNEDGMQRRRQGPGAMDIERERDARPVPWEQRVLDAGERFLDRIGALGRDEPIPARPQDRPARRREGGDREGGRVHHEVGHMPGRNAQNDQPEEHDQFIVEEPRRARYWPF